MTSCRAPSAVWTIEIPSLAFLIAMLMPRICESIRVEIAKPAASSAAELIRLPDERRSMAVSISLRDSIR